MIEKITRISDLDPDVRYEFVTATGRRAPAEVFKSGGVTVEVPGGSGTVVELYQGNLDFYGGHFEVVKESLLPTKPGWYVLKAISDNSGVWCRDEDGLWARKDVPLEEPQTFEKMMEIHNGVYGPLVRLVPETGDNNE